MWGAVCMAWGLAFRVRCCGFGVWCPRSSPLTQYKRLRAHSLAWTTWYFQMTTSWPTVVYEVVIHSGIRGNHLKIGPHPQGVRTYTPPQLLTPQHQPPATTHQILTLSTSLERQGVQTRSRRSHQRTSTRRRPWMPRPTRPTSPLRQPR